MVGIPNLLRAMLLFCLIGVATALSTSSLKAWGEQCWGEDYCCDEEEQSCCWDNAICDPTSWDECEVDANRGCEGVIGNSQCYTHLECLRP